MGDDDLEFDEMSAKETCGGDFCYMHLTILGGCEMVLQHENDISSLRKRTEE